jgi:hypothetical protein
MKLAFSFTAMAIYVMREPGSSDDSGQDEEGGTTSQMCKKYIKCAKNPADPPYGKDG